MTTTTVSVRGLVCGLCLARLLDGVRGLLGVRSAAARLGQDGSSRLTLEASPMLTSSALRAAVAATGFEVVEATAVPSRPLNDSTREV